MAHIRVFPMRIFALTTPDVPVVRLPADIPGNLRHRGIDSRHAGFLHAIPQYQIFPAAIAGACPGAAARRVGLHAGGEFVGKFCFVAGGLRENSRIEGHGHRLDHLLDGKLQLLLAGGIEVLTESAARKALVPTDANTFGEPHGTEEG